MKFETFRVKATGDIVRYPAHYATHPVFGPTLELYTPGETEEDKVVVDEDHVLPTEQRTRRVARKPKGETETGEAE